MINFNPELTQEQARWILEDLIPTDGYRINHQTLTNWAKGHNYAFNEKVGIPSCSCEYVATMKVWQGRINQYDPQIRAIAYPITTTETGQTGYTENNPKPKVGRKPKAASGLTE